MKTKHLKNKQFRKRGNIILDDTYDDTYDDIYDDAYDDNPANSGEYENE